MPEPVPAVIQQAYDPAVDVTTLREWPGNPNEGDVGAVSQSIDALGFYGAVLAQVSSRRVISGNHRLKAAIAKDMPTLPVIWCEVDDEEARAMLIGENEHVRKGRWDEAALVAFLTDTATNSPRLLPVTGLDGDDLDDLIRALNPPSLESIAGSQRRTENDMWPSLSIRLSPDDRERFYRLTEDAQDRSDTGRLVHLLDTAGDPADDAAA